MFAGKMKKPALCYWICATPRTGGWFLCQLLTATGVAGRPKEYFLRDNEPAYRQRWNVSSYSDYLDQVLIHGTTPNGVFGVKLDTSTHLAHFESQLRTIPRFSSPSLSFYTLLTAIFPNLKFIWLTRRNKVRQAVSWWKAVQTNEWQRHKDNPPQAQQSLEYNFTAIDQLANESLMREAAWQELFAAWQVKPLIIVYEDLIDDYAGTITKVLGFLGVDEPYQPREDEITLVKQADSLSEEWVQRYRQEKQRHWVNKAW